MRRALILLLVLSLGFFGCGGENPMKDLAGPEVPQGEVWSAYVSPTVVILRRGQRSKLKVILVRRSGRPHRFAIWVEAPEGGRPWWAPPLYLYVEEKAEREIPLHGSYDAIESGDYTLKIESVDGHGKVAFSLPFKIRKWEPHLVTPPVASLTYSPAEVYVGTQVVFDASESYDPDGFIKNFLWYVDGHFVQSGGNILRWSFSSEGPHTVEVVVVDNDGARGAAAVLVDVLAP